MKTIVRVNVMLSVGLLALPLTTQIGLAQSCAPGLGMSASDLLFGKQHPAPADFTSFSFAGSVNFGGPRAILASSINHAWVIDSGEIAIVALTYSPTNNSLTGQPVNIGNLATTPVALAWDGTYLWGLDQQGNFNLPYTGVAQPRGGTLYNAQLPTTSMISDGEYLWISDSGGNVFRVLPSVAAAPVITQVRLPGVNGAINALMFDGFHIWAVTSGVEPFNGPALFKIDSSTLAVSAGPSISDLTAPKSIRFDGLSMWVTSLNAVARITSGTRTGTYTASDARSLSFDGSQMWVANRSSNSVTATRACDGASTLDPLTVPAYPENVAFDGRNLWVTSPTSKTVSIR
jgi:hypothetical protein